MQQTEKTSAQNPVQEMVLNSDRNPEIESAIIWQHIDLNKEGALHWLEKHAKLDRSIAAALSATETRPRSFKSKNGILIILRGVNLNPGHDPEDMVSIRVWLENHRVITVRQRHVVAIEDMRCELEEGDGAKTVGTFLSTLIDKLADRIGDYVEKLDEGLENIEQRLEDIDPADVRANLGSLRKQIVTLRRYLAPQRDALERLAMIEISFLGERDHLRLREEADRFSRYIEDIDLARERASVVHEAFLSQIAQQQNNRMYALSIITAIFLPLGFLTGLLGINVGGMPGADQGAAFWIVCGVLSAIAFLILYLFRRLKWL